MPSLTSSLPFSPAELAYLHTSLSSHPPLRPDARSSATDFRPLRAETGVLPSVNGSAHVGFSDGREAIVGVKLEVGKTTGVPAGQPSPGDDVPMAGAEPTAPKSGPSRGGVDWVTVTLTLPGLRDDDPNLAFLEEMLREPLLLGAPHAAPADGVPCLLDSLVINTRWHWHIYIDILLISPHGLASYPLPLLSMTTHLALRDTRVPRLKSEGDEDPVADDDWMASTYLYPRPEAGAGPKPPVTLLVIVVGDNVIFDPSREELAVADGVLAVSVASHLGHHHLLAVRMIDMPARNTMQGVAQSGEAQSGEAPGVWKQRVGGIKRSLMKDVLRTVVTGGVAQDVMAGLDGFLEIEAGSETR